MRGVYLVLDVDATAGRSPFSVAEAALRGGVHAIQWRQKTGSLAAWWSELLRTRTLCQAHDALFLINDRVDVALAVHADGVHVGQDDLPASVARGLVPNRALGVSVTELPHVQPASAAGADYLGVGPIFPTSSKLDAVPPLGLDFLRRVREVTQLPLVAIGGITAENAGEVMAEGADAVAVLSAICAATLVEAATRTLVDRVEGTMIR